MADSEDRQPRRDAVSRAQGEPMADWQAPGWDRPSVTFRLTKARRDALMSLGSPESTRDGPTAALDLAIARAARSELELSGNSAMEEPGASDTWARLDLITQSLDDMGSRLNLVQATLAGALNHPATEPDSPWASATTVGDWAEREAGRSKAWVVARAKWIAARPRGSGRIVVLASLQRVSGEALAGKESEPLTIIGPMRVGAMAAFDSDRPATLVCWRASQGWTCRIHAHEADGALGEPFDQFSG